MARTTDNPKTERLIFRATPELKHALEKFAEDNDTSLSDAAHKAIEYGILYYYYTIDQN